MKINARLAKEGITPSELDEISKLLLQMRFMLASANLVLDMNLDEIRKKGHHIQDLADKMSILAEYMRNYPK